MMHKHCLRRAVLLIALCPSSLLAQPSDSANFVPTEAWRTQRRAELTNASRLFSPGETHIYSGEHLGAIRLPVGGVGTGSILMDGHARRVGWQLWRNFTEFPLPHSVFAVRARAGNAPPVVRAMQTVSEGSLPGMASLRFRGEYPFGWYEFEDPALPVRVSLETFSPLIPLDTENSAIPCAIFNLSATNSSEGPVEVAFLATQQNAAGLVDTMPPATNRTRLIVERRTPERWAVEGRASDQYGGNQNAIVRGDGWTKLHMTGKHSKDSPAYGELVLAARDVNARATASWDNFETLCAEFAASGRVAGPAKAGPSVAGQTLDGALATPFVLTPGESRTVTFVLTWYFPNIPMVLDEKCPKWDHDGYAYARRWPDGLALAKDVLSRLDALSEQTRRFHKTFYASNLPHWLLDRIVSQVATLRSPTCFWANDDHFGCWEGCSWTYGSCAGNATHVWGYAQALSRLFPSLGRKMREQEHAEQNAAGMLPVRLGMRRPFQAFDGQCHSILASYLGHQLTTDGAWLARQWPKIRQSMDYLIKNWDPDGDGMLAGPQHGMDSSHGGTSSWMGSMYLAALAAAERMALLQQEPDAAKRYRAIREIGAKNQDERLFNGEYFIQIPDATPRKDYLTGCYTDQMLGQWWAQRLGLGWIYPREHVRSAMQSLFRYNLRTDFYGFKQSPRKFVPDDEAAMVQCSWPRGGRPNPENTMLHADEVKVCISHAVEALMVDCGLLTEGFALARANADRYDGRLRTGLDETPWSGLGVSGNPFGDDCAGKFYARSLSIWSMLLACQGMTFDGPRRAIAFDPTWQPEDHRSFFTAAEGWGTFSQVRERTSQREKIELAWGSLRLRELTLTLPEGAKPTAVRVRASGGEIKLSHSLDGIRLRIELAAEVALAAGDALEASIEFEQ